MQTFFVQIKCELGRTYEAAQAIADLELHSEIYSTAGAFDLIVSTTSRTTSTSGSSWARTYRPSRACATPIR